MLRNKRHHDLDVQDNDSLNMKSSAMNGKLCLLGSTSIRRAFSLSRGSLSGDPFLLMEFGVGLDGKALLLSIGG